MARAGARRCRPDRAAGVHAQRMFRVGRAPRERRRRERVAPAPVPRGAAAGARRAGRYRAARHGPWARTGSRRPRRPSASTRARDPWPGPRRRPRRRVRGLGARSAARRGRRPTPSERWSAHRRSICSGVLWSPVVAMRTGIPASISRGTAATTFSKLRGARMTSLTSGSAESNETWTVTGPPPRPRIRESSFSVNSVALLRTRTGSRAPRSSSTSGISGTRNGSPPVTPSARKPSSRAWPASSTISSGCSDRRATAGADSVRQYGSAGCSDSWSTARRVADQPVVDGRLEVRRVTARSRGREPLDGGLGLV